MGTAGKQDIMALMVTLSLWFIFKNAKVNGQINLVGNRNFNTQ